MASEKKVGLRLAVILGVCILLAGYFLGSAVPISDLASGSFMGSSGMSGGGRGDGGNRN